MRAEDPMQTNPSDSMLRFLAGLASFVYVAIWIGGVVVLLSLPLVRALAGESSNWDWGLPVQVRFAGSPAPVVTAWGTAVLEIEDVRADLRLPIPSLPWWMVGVLWLHACLGFGLMLAFVHQLRRILRRARDGAPFDPDNARCLKQLGLLLIAIVVVNGVAEFATSAAVRAGLADADLAVPVGLHLNGWAILTALVLLALARVFQRGADLEREQSLVV
jgi:hypothetical protein